MSLSEAAPLEESIIQNISIDIDSPSVIRTGNEVIFILRVDNLNEEIKDNDLS